MIVTTLGCLALAWWQWERFESASGTGQNLGYALQWPLFAGFAVFAYLRFVRLEREASADTVAQDGAPQSGTAIAVSERAAKTVGTREIPAGLLPERPKATRDEDPVLTEYNRYLAALYAEDVTAHSAEDITAHSAEDITAHSAENSTAQVRMASQPTHERSAG